MSIKRTIEWAAIFGTLGAFTLWVGSAYAAPKQQLLTDIQLTSYHSNHVVYFEDRHGRIEREQFVCAITESQLHQLEATYAVTLVKRQSHGRTITVAVVTVGNHGTKTVKKIVGAREARQCQHRVYRSVLYFFTVPSLS